MRYQDFLGIIMKLLVIEDEKELAASIREGLLMDGYEVEMTHDGLSGLEMCQEESYDLILLDLNLPGMDGMEILHEFRKTNLVTPVIILSARIQLSDKIQGLDEGANDYLTKPFHFEELEARIRSLTRRKFIQESVTLSMSGISFDTRTRKVTVAGKEVHLTKKESGILEYLMLHPERYISQETLIEHLWDSNADEFSNSIRVHISSLRKKLKAELGFDPIQNKIGQGYMLGDFE